MPTSLFDKITRENGSQTPDLFTPLSSEIKITDGASGFQVAKGLKILDLDVIEPSRLMFHPREDGSVQADFQVKDPDEITITGIFESIDYASNMEELRIIKNNSTELTVQGRGNNYFKMYIETLPSKASARNFSTLTVNIKLKEAQVFKTSEGGLSQDEVAKPADTDTVDNGLKAAQPSTDAIESTATIAVTGSA